ncbi:MAG TPA: FAD-dependent oxidoreductase, partial [Acidimicrobiales bacterium]|nr:FAD-dependent oxidoreductase [Acidimicrobiales bacterium]
RQGVELMPLSSSPGRPHSSTNAQSRSEKHLQTKANGGEHLALISRSVRGLVENRHIYMVPRSDGRVILGATSEEKGFDTSTTVEAVHDLLHGARMLIPGVAEMQIEEVNAGLRPGSPDNFPMIGPTANQQILAATGHYRNGILLAPITARIICETIISGTFPDSYNRFLPTRFSTMSDIASVAT